MVDKQKISHFESEGYSNSQSGDHLPDRSRLAKLYPTPKTYDERKADDERTKQVDRLRWPKYPVLNSAVYGSGVIVVAIWFIQNINAWWFGTDNRGMAMGAVFFSFAIWMVLMFITVARVLYVSKLFSHFGGKERLFWTVSGVTLAVTMGLWLSGLILNYTHLLWIPIFVVVQFVLVYVSMRRLMR